MHKRNSRSARRYQVWRRTWGSARGNTTSTRRLGSGADGPARFSRSRNDSCRSGDRHRAIRRFASRNRRSPGAARHIVRNQGRYEEALPLAERGAALHHAAATGSESGFSCATPLRSASLIVRDRTNQGRPRLPGWSVRHLPLQRNRRRSADQLQSAAQDVKPICWTATFGPAAYIPHICLGEAEKLEQCSVHEEPSSVR